MATKYASRDTLHAIKERLDEMFSRALDVGSERGYHYLGSARIYYRMGKAFGEGMIELLGK
ncbi:MAG: hypothetical protein JW741_00435 [Sedimentisphaerales bacterium]|nr:hypothetical protein [Sedimentisphaerales bacterium]